MGEVQTLDKSLHSLSGLNLSLFLRFGLAPVRICAIRAQQLDENTFAL